MASDQRYEAGLSATLQGASVPYGYTLTIWCSGHVLSDFRGDPRYVTIALFVAGATAAFILLRWISREARPDARPGGGSDRPHLLAAVVVQVAAIVIAVALVTLVAQVPWAIDWAAGGFVATAVYMTGTAAGVALRS